MAKITNNTLLNEGNLNGGFYIAFISGTTRLDGYMAQWGEQIILPTYNGIIKWKDINSQSGTGFYNPGYPLEITKSYIFEAITTSDEDTPSGCSITYITNNATVNVSAPTNAEAGTEVTFTASAINTTSTIIGVTIATSNGTIALTPVSGKTYSFIMPNENVIITINATIPTHYILNYKFMDGTNEVNTCSLGFSPFIGSHLAEVGTTYTATVQLNDPYLSFSVSTVGTPVYTVTGNKISFVMPAQNHVLTVYVYKYGSIN